MPEHQPQVDEVFDEALRRAAGPDRAHYLDEACGGDLELRRRVERLLRAVAEAGSFLEAPAQDPSPTVDEPLVAERPGAVIGPYKLIEPIGEGGMGTVWMAQQTEPVKRLVALKLIKAGMDSKQVIARFEAERQALALMDHPNIAKVLDGGTTEANAHGQPSVGMGLPSVGVGRPYFVMDLVKGVPITRYCDEHHLTPRQRLELFIPVCQAVQHAHQKGIIHRDLKPSNVLVALYDGKPVPKVIDFGVAKATGQSLTDKTLATGFGTIVGTLEYMSPEQAEINQLDIDTRSDIYSLGVLLYELLTGSPPFTRKELEKTGMLEMLRVIREKEPSKPSTKLSTAEGLPTLAANRGTEPAKLTRLVRGELDWIVMKCLEKDRDFRYETALDLANDIQRYLHDQPVLACPPRLSYVVRKFVQRNRGLVAAVAAVLLVVLGGSAATTMAYLQADAAKRAEMTQRIEAEEAGAEARATLDFLTYDLLALDPDAEAGSPNVTILESLDAAAPKIDRRLARQPRVEAAVRHVIGATYRFHGQPEKAWPHLERAVGLRRSVLGPDHPATLASSHHLANVLHRLGKLPEAEALCATVLESRRKQWPTGHEDIASSLALSGLILTDKGLPNEAEPLLREALDIFRTALPEGHWRTANVRSLLGGCLSAQGAYQEAERLLVDGYEGLRNAQGAPPHHTQLALQRIGRLYESWGKDEEAQKWRQKG
jgi:serine/threonine protein kinase/tetratricopeptide (TPR) repeat protein